MASEESLSAILLAAGKGTRMKSALPKVLHPIAGRPMISWVIRAVREAGVADVTVVLSPDLSRFDKFLSENPDVRIAIQNGQNGTGDAVASAACSYSGVNTPSYTHGELKKGQPQKTDWILITAGDTPAISAKTLREFIASVKNSKKKLAVLGMNVSDPRGYGRLVQDSKGGLLKIVEERDADAETKKISLCNSGIIMARCELLFDLLCGIAPHNAQNEYYLTDVFSALVKRGETAHVFETFAEHEFAGVNDRVQLEAIECWMQAEATRDWMRSGVTIHLPATVYIEADVEIEQDVEIFPSVCLQGATKLSRGVHVGSGTVLDSVEVGGGAVIGANCVLTRMRVMAGSRVPPGAVRTEMDF